MIEIAIDVGQVRKALGAAEETTRNMSDAKFSASTLGALRNASAMDFYIATDTAAQADESLGHVYEWGMRGSPEGRLYALNFIGANQYVARMVYDFKESAVPVPVGGENAEDTRSAQHIFYAKAWMFEDGATVTISPQVAQALAWPTGQSMAFTSGTLHIRLTSQYIGRFAQHWQQYWAGGLGEVSAERVAKKIDKRFQVDMNTYIEKEVKGTFLRAKSAVTKPGQRVRVRIMDEGRPVSAAPKKVNPARLENTVEKTFGRQGVRRAQ